MATKDIVIDILDAPAGDVVIPTLTPADLYPVPATEVPGDLWTVELWVPLGDALYQAESIFWQASIDPAAHVPGAPFPAEMIAERRFVFDRLEGEFKVWRCINAPGAVTHARQFGRDYGGFFIAYRNLADGPISPSSALMPWAQGAWNNVEAPPPPPPPPPPPDGPDAPPPAPVGNPTPTATRTALDAGWGIGFQFRQVGSSAGVAAGQYWNGDWFVYNPANGPGVRCTESTPNSVNRGDGTRMHGMMLKPIINRTSYPDRAEQGFDGYANGNHMGRHTRYNAALNVNPNLGGDIVFAPGEEGSLYKAHSLTSPTSSARSIFKAFAIVTIVNQIPPVGSFRPCPDRDTVSKAAIATIDQLDLVSHPTLNVAHPIKFSIAQTIRYLTGPFMSPALGARPNSSLYGQDQTHPKNDPLYNAVFAQAVQSAHAHIMNSATRPQDRRTIMALMCQIGLDIIQANTTDRFEYSPAHSYSPWISLFDFAETCLDNAAVRAAAAAARLQDRLHEREIKQGRNANENGGNPGTSGKSSLRFIDASDMWFRTPPEGLQSNVNWNKPTQTPFVPDQEWNTGGPYTGGHIGMPFRTGSGSPNGGYHSNPNMSYTRLGMANTFTQAIVGAYEVPTLSGVVVANPIEIQYCDRIGRYMAAHHDPADPCTLEGGPEWVNDNWTIWDRYVLQLWQHARPLMADEVPIWVGQPEQPFPPLVTSPSAGRLRVVMLPTQIANGSPITRREFRYRKVMEGNPSNKVTSAIGNQNESLRDAIFYNRDTPWTTWQQLSGEANPTGLQSGLYQVQVRLVSALGASAPSTNCPWRYDCAAAYGLPAGPRALVYVS